MTLSEAYGEYDDGSTPESSIYSVYEKAYYTDRKFSPSASSTSCAVTNLLSTPCSLFWSRTSDDEFITLSNSAHPHTHLASSNCVSDYGGESTSISLSSSPWKSVVTSSTLFSPITLSSATGYPTSTLSASPLASALVDAGCSNFLYWLQSDASTWDFFSSRELMVFAPSDDFFPFERGISARQDAESTQRLKQQASNNITNARDSTVIPMDSTDSNTSNNATTFVTNVPPVQNSTSSARLIRHRENATPVKIFSGLGNIVNITREDMAYENGLIQVTDGCVFKGSSFIYQDIQRARLHLE